jgi:uncharacterized Zn finger protein
VIDSCPVCGGDRLVEVLYHRGTPVHQNTLMATRSEVLACPRGDIALTQCAACGFVFNAAFDEIRTILGSLGLRADVISL